LEKTLHVLDSSSVHHKKFLTAHIAMVRWRTEGGGLGGSNPLRNSEGPPISCRTQPDCESC